MALQQLGAFATGWLSSFCLAVSMFGSICALGRVGGTLVRPRPSSLAPVTWPDISILKPLSGLEAKLSENIETYFNQDYPGDIQFVFGVRDPDDGAIPVVRADPNLAKSSKTRPRDSKDHQRKGLGFPWILLSELSLFNGLRRPPRPKIFSGFLPLPGPDGFIWDRAKLP
jgi:hypothetical protein